MPRVFSAASAAKQKRISRVCGAVMKSRTNSYFYLSARFSLIIVWGIGEAKKRSCDGHSFGIMDANLIMTAEQNGPNVARLGGVFVYLCAADEAELRARRFSRFGQLTDAEISERASEQ